MQNIPPYKGEDIVDREVDIGKSFLRIFSFHTWEVPRRPQKNITSLKNIDPKLLGYYIFYGNLEEWLTIANMDNAPAKWQELLDDSLFPYFLHLDAYELPDIENSDLRALRDFVIQRLKPDIKILLRRSRNAVSDVLNKQ